MLDGRAPESDDDGADDGGENQLGDDKIIKADSKAAGKAALKAESDARKTEGNKRPVRNDRTNREGK